MSKQPLKSVPTRTMRREADSVLREGTQFWRWEQGENLAPQKLMMYTDENAFFLYAKPDDKSKPNLLWDFSLISDVRSGLPTKDVQPHDNLRLMKSTDIKDYFLTVVYRRDGIVNLEYVGLMCEAPDLAARWKKAVNVLLLRNPHRNAGMATSLSKHHTQILLSCNGYGQISAKSIHNALLQRYLPDSDLSKVLSFYSILKTTEDGMQYVQDTDFTEEIYKLILNQLTNMRNNVDCVLMSIGEKTAKRQQMTLHEFQGFISNNQRNPFLKDAIVCPITKTHAQALVEKYEEKAVEGIVTAKAIFNYLLSDECNVVNTELLEQTMDMSHPLSHYFINSSHNTYLSGYQYNSMSSVEMYRQCLLLGCRCIELDCWPEGEDIIITHGGTLCSKIQFEDVVEAINDYAFVTSSYPVILSIENHCKSPFLLQKMARIFVETFGDKLLATPMEDIPLEAGHHLPSPERLKQKILIKCKVKRQRGDPSDSSRFSPDYDVNGTDIHDTGIQDTSANDGQDLSKDGEDTFLMPPSNAASETEPEARKQDSDWAQVSLQPRSSNEGGLSLIDLVNYCTGISFEGFDSAERLNCSFYQSSFPDDKALSLLKSSPVQLARYNVRQLIRIYPQLARINSSNYMPQIFWNAGCQLAALNFQHSDTAACLNHTKFEYNCSTGYLLKPAVMIEDSGNEGFNPFTQAVLKNIVPVNLAIKVMSGLFLTEKQVACYALVDLFGLQADTIANKFLTEKKEAPNPIWEHEPFIFNKIILPQLATVHFAVYNEEKELLGQRFIPVCAIMAGYRYVPLRNRHNEPLPLAALFVHITVEDWIHDDMKAVADLLTDPIANQSKVSEPLQLQTEKAANLSSPSQPIFPDTLPIIELAKTRVKPVAVHYEDDLVLHDQGMLRKQKKVSTERRRLTDRHDRALKSLETKQMKSKISLNEATKSGTELESLHVVELCDFDKQAMQETLEKHLAILKEVHYKQKKQIMHQHKLEVKQIGSEIITEVGLQSTPKSSTIDDRVTKFGTRMRRKLEELQMQEILALESDQNSMQELLINKYTSQTGQVNGSVRTN